MYNEKIFAEGNPYAHINPTFSIVNQSYSNESGAFSSITFDTSTELDTAAYNGGYTKTMKLLRDSENYAYANGNPAYAGVNSPGNDLNKDQRGVLRKSTPSIGAYEDKPICPERTIWLSGAVDDNWNNPSNWSDGIPCITTIVTIASGAPYYPILDANTAPDPVCHTIHFEAGSEVHGTAFLTYTTASVDLELPHSRWYMLSAPLNDMYTGDYFLSETRRNPAVAMMQYQKDNPQHTSIVKEQGKWSNTFNSLNVFLGAGEGYAVRIKLNNLDPETAPANYTFTFPRNETSYYYYDIYGNRTDKSDATPRSGKNGRFIYESATDYNPNDGSFSLPVDNSNENNYTNLIIGNPFMAHLSLTELYKGNQDNLNGTFRLWTQGGAVETYMLNGEDGVISTEGDATPVTIAPMQSFFAERKTSFSGNVQFSPTMTTVDVSTKLRAPRQPDTCTDGKLHVTVSRDGKRESGAVIVYKPGASNAFRLGEDAKSFFISNLNNAPAVVYSAVDGCALAINTIGSLSEDIALGISTSIQGALRFDFSGMELFDMETTDYDFLFVDKKTGHSQNLLENPTYEFYNDAGNVEDRFFIRITPKENAIAGTPASAAASSNMHCYIASGRIHIASTGENIRQIEFINLQGQRVSKQIFSMDTQRVEVPLFALEDDAQLLILKVKTDRETYSMKIVLSK